MNESNIIEEYNQNVTQKYRLYNSLFTSLPYEKVKDIGMIIPLLNKACSNGLNNGQDPVQIIDKFYADYGDMLSGIDLYEFLFRVIQYIERQVVLFDSIEDSLFSDHLNIDLEQLFIQYKNEPLEYGLLMEKLRKFSVRLVFTAHPTQFYPIQVQEILEDLRCAIHQNDVNDIDFLLQQLGMTSLLNENKPTPYQEALNIIYYLRRVYYPAIANYFETIKDKIFKGETFENFDLIQIGFWPGGDRDGNPFVNADTTMKVADELRMSLMKCYYNDLKELMRKLTFKGVHKRLTAVRDLFYNGMFSADTTLDIEYCIEELSSTKVLIEDKYNGLFADLLGKFIDKMRIFRTHFATLDIRQDASIHRQTIAAIFEKYNISDKHPDDIPYDELLEIIDKTEEEILATDFDDPLIRDTIRNIKQLQQIQSKNGEKGCNRYIISNSESEEAVLHVYALFRLCGYNDEDITFDIVPLFETMRGMNNSESVMYNLYRLPRYAAHLQRRNDRQTIMLGFSDGTKDGGYLKANWEIYNTKEKLSKLSQEENIAVVFFDGRGGPPARGGGKTHQYYASQGKGIANHEIQLTIQGQTITSRYSTIGQFLYNCEQMILAGLTNELESDGVDIKREERVILDLLAATSYSVYEKLKNHPKFVPYLEHMSTLKYYSKANIGSRPAKRSNNSKLEFKDLRAISFVGSWSQLRQNVPGYYGIGTALQKLYDLGRGKEVEQLFANVPYFKALMLNSMMSLEKSCFELTTYMQDNQEYADFWKILFEEYKLSVEYILKISGYTELMQEEPVSRISIDIREEIVLPLLTMQQYALQKIAKNDKDIQILEKIVSRTMYGNINASRNSA